jgi:hypothetical protein
LKLSGQTGKTRRLFQVVANIHCRSQHGKLFKVRRAAPRRVKEIRRDVSLSPAHFRTAERAQDVLGQSTLLLVMHAK